MRTRQSGEPVHWALVTGASDGIGRAFVIELAAAGYGCVLVARRADHLQVVTEQIGQDRCLVLAEDLGDPAAISRLAEATAHLRIDLLIAAAGYGTSGPFLTVDPQQELQMIDVNCRAVVALVHRFGQSMVARQHGGIVLFSSLVAFQGVPLSANYAATKAFIQTLAEGLRPELRPFGVDVLSVAPGPIASGFAARAGLKLGLSQTPDIVARQALAALGERTTVRPGWLAKLLIGSLSLLPRGARTVIMARVMAGMTRA